MAQSLVRRLGLSPEYLQRPEGSLVESFQTPIHLSKWQLRVSRVFPDNL